MMTLMRLIEKGRKRTKTANVRGNKKRVEETYLNKTESQKHFYSSLQKSVAFYDSIK